MSSSGRHPWDANDPYPTRTSSVSCFDDCPDCQGTGQAGTWDCYLCHGTGQVRDDVDDVADTIMAAPDDDVLSGKMDGLANGTHYLDRDGIIRQK